MKSGMQQVPLQQQQNRVVFRWLGVEAARTQQQLQQQIALMNVLMKVPPQLLGGRQFNMVPIIERAIDGACGPKLAQKVFPSAAGVEPDVENQILAMGVDIPVHPADNDAEHMQEHLKLAPSPIRDGHIRKHQQQMSAKHQAEAQAQQQQQGGGQGPQAGGQPKGPQAVKGPPGQLKPGQMAGGMPQRAA